MPKLKCVVCSNHFNPPRYNSTRCRYCSPKCRRRFHNNKKIEKMGRDEHNRRQREYLYKKSENDKREKIKCEICGKCFRQVGSHIVSVHKITAREYRKRYGFDVKKGQLPNDYRELKAEQAIECGGYVNLRKGKKFWFEKGQDGPGKYKRSDETLERLRAIGLRNPKRTKKNCFCGTKLTGNRSKYCSRECRLIDYKKKYNPHKVKLFYENASKK